MIRNETEYTQAVARLNDETARLAEQRKRLAETGLSPEEIARLAQEARREARLNRGRMFRAAAVGQSEPYRALGRGTGAAPTSGVTGNGLGRSGNGPSRPQSRPGVSRTGRPQIGRP